MERIMGGGRLITSPIEGKMSMKIISNKLAQGKKGITKLGKKYGQPTTDKKFRKLQKTSTKTCLVSNN